MRWIVLGSSGTAPEEYAGCPDGCVVITTNSGIQIEPAPDYYFLSDQVACHKWNDAARKVRNEYGTTCVTLFRQWNALHARRVEWFDMFVREGHPYEPFQVSGLWCLEFACRSRATEIYMAGLNGYGSSGYFDRDDPECAKVSDHLDKIVQPKMAALLAKYPHVQFYACGSPQYAVEADNWQQR